MIHQAKKVLIFISFFNLLFLSALAQQAKPQFTHADTLRGSLNAERAYNVLKYDISVTPDFETKSIRGKTIITYIDSGLREMQIDLQTPLEIDSILQGGKSISFHREGNAFHVGVNSGGNEKICLSCVKTITIFYHGNPQIAVHPPWGGGFIFTKDSLGRPWMSVACE